MKIPCEIDNVKTVKKGMKITLAIDEKEVQAVMKSLYNFMDKPLEVELLVDAAEQKDRLGRISEEQRKKTYAILRDIAEYVGDSVDSLKIELKRQFTSETQHADFSLSDCPSDLARDFIEWLIGWAFENGVALTDHPREAFEDIEDYMRMCLKHGICCVCGKPGEEHHVDTIGMGRNRKTVDDSGNEKTCLCRVHHSEAHTIGWESFAKKHHVVGVIA